MNHHITQSLLNTLDSSLECLEIELVYLGKFTRSYKAADFVRQARRFVQDRVRVGHEAYRTDVAIHYYILFRLIN